MSPFFMQPGGNRKAASSFLKTKGHPRGSSNEAGAKLLELSMWRCYYKWQLSEWSERARESLMSPSHCVRDQKESCWRKEVGNNDSSAPWALMVRQTGDNQADNATNFRGWSYWKLGVPTEASDVSSLSPQSRCPLDPLNYSLGSTRAHPLIKVFLLVLERLLPCLLLYIYLQTNP